MGFFASLSDALRSIASKEARMGALIFIGAVWLFLVMAYINGGDGPKYPPR